MPSPRFLGLCELLLRTQALVEDLRFGCGLKGLRQSPALQTGVIYNICTSVAKELL